MVVHNGEGMDVLLPRSSCLYVLLIVSAGVVVVLPPAIVGLAPLAWWGDESAELG